MQGGRSLRVSFLAGLGPLVRDPEGSLRFYRDLLGLPLVGDDYGAADNWQGLRHFGQWTLADAAESIFGTREWPADVPVPQVNLEFDVESEAAVEAAAREIQAAGYPILSGPKKEPWNQTVVRLLGPEGHLVSITYTPWPPHEPTCRGVAAREPGPAARRSGGMPLEPPP